MRKRFAKYITITILFIVSCLPAKAYDNKKINNSQDNRYHASSASYYTETNSTSQNIFFSCDFEKGYQYMGKSNAHPGGGYFSHMGGKVTAKEADLPKPCSKRNRSLYHYTVISSEPDAQKSVPDSGFSLKTPYKGHCNNESFTRDTTIITLNENKPEFYIRWYQKWTGNWMNGSVQQKFTKFHMLGKSTSLYSTAYFQFTPRKTNLSQAYLKNVDGQFNTASVKRAKIVRVYATPKSAGRQYKGVRRAYDNYNNMLGDDNSDMDFFFKPNIWYCIEIHVRVNSNALTNDAVLEYWVDGKKIFQLTQFRFYGENDPVISGTGVFEMQHIYYKRDTNDDQPTFMDNIVIADHYIGPVK